MAVLPLFQDSSFETRRKISITCFCFWMFLNGVTYSVILSSLWYYIEWYNSTNLFLGVVLSFFAASGALTAPLYGFYSDLSKRVRLLSLISCLVFIIGNLVYSLSFSKYLALIGVALCGIGGSIVDVVFGELSRITNAEERIIFISVLEAARLVGFVGGPCLNLFLHNCSFSLGAWKIFYGNCSSLFVCSLWIMLFIVHYLFSSTLSSTARAQYEKLNEITADFSDLKEEGESTDERLEEDGTKKCYERESGEIEATKQQLLQNDGLPDNDLSDDQQEEHAVPNLTKDLRRPETLVLLWVQFFLALISSAFSTILPLIAKEKLGWDKNSISLMFVLIGILLISTASFISLCPSLLHDRQMFLLSAGSFVVVLPQLFLVAYLQDVHILTWIIIVLIFLLSITGPCLLVTVSSLMSKLSSENHFDFNQSLLVTASSCAGMLGPLLGGLLFDEFVVFAVLVNVASVFTLLAVVFVYKKLKGFKV